MYSVVIPGPYTAQSKPVQEYLVRGQYLVDTQLRVQLYNIMYSVVIPGPYTAQSKPVQDTLVRGQYSSEYTSCTRLWTFTHVHFL